MAAPHHGLVTWYFFRYIWSHWSEEVIFSQVSIAFTKRELAPKASLRDIYCLMTKTTKTRIRWEGHFQTEYTTKIPIYRIVVGRMVTNWSPSPSLWAILFTCWPTTHLSVSRLMELSQRRSLYIMTPKTVIITETRWMVLILVRKERIWRLLTVIIKVCIYKEWYVKSCGISVIKANEQSKSKAVWGKSIPFPGPFLILKGKGEYNG